MRALLLDKCARIAVRAASMALFLTTCAIPLTSQAQEAPASATVLVRVGGTVRIEVIRVPGLAPEVIVLPDVEISTGSGFVVSSDGYIVTNHHVVADDAFAIRLQGQKAQITLKVERIDVVFPPDPAASPGQPQRYSASVVASDPELDLALLHVSALGLPIARLGDSDVAAPGEPVQALGYPLGDFLEIARTGRDDVAPAVSVSPGAVSALRTDDQGELTYLQTTATLNPGNSGGPLVDQEGYVIGVVRLQVRGATGIGFAIPINRVKRFLALRGVDHLLPVRALALGAVYAPLGKGLSVRLPEGFQDESRTRLRIEAAFEKIDLRVDRVASTWRGDRIEQALLSGQVFEQPSWLRRTGGATFKKGGFIAGAASARTGDTRDELAMEYALMHLGGEWLVARYVGPADAIAFNRGPLRASLTSLEGESLITGDFDGKQEVKWVPVQAFTAPVPPLFIPAGWIAEPGAAPQCDGLPVVESGLTASPPHDFTIALRASSVPGTGLDPTDAAARCSPRRSSFGGASYQVRTDWLGTAYTIEGLFIRHSAGLLHLQLVTPVAKSVAARDLFAAWVRQLGQ